MTEYESRGQKCPKCNFRFEVLADEAGTHECPKCGFQPGEINARIRCNDCGMYFKDQDELMIFKDSIGEFVGCPVCETDECLIDLD